MYIQSAALVTNLSVHFKWGRDSSLVWVTTLDRATPVQSVAVAVRDCSGKLLWQGKTDKSGRQNIKGELVKGKRHLTAKTGFRFTCQRKNCR
ncbi:MAG: hypothetical protein IPP36_11350 [Nitrosomonadales bacterium]|nr:hypothetical protein [Nitrosomonadales bacterium]